MCLSYQGRFSFQTSTQGIVAQSLPSLDGRVARRRSFKPVKKAREKAVGFFQQT